MSARAPLAARLEWRWQLLRDKLTGAFPALRWSELIRVLLPLAVVSRPLRVEPVESDDQGVLWRTAIGRFWGRADHRRELETVSLEQVLGIYQRGPVRIRRGDVVLDVGGHLGTFARVALDRGASRVVVLEPSSEAVGFLQRSFAAEIAADRVTVVQTAVWERAAELYLAGGHTFTSREECGSDDPLVVAARSIDAVVTELGLDRVDFVKMDIEGSERHALRGASRLLAEHAPRLAICIYHLPDDPEVIRERILEAQPAYREHHSDIGSEQVYFYRS